MSPSVMTETRPEATAAAGATGAETIDAMTYKALAKDSKKDPRKSYQGWAIYWTIIPKAKFEISHDIDFIHTILNGDIPATNYSVLEAVVFVPELCNFLPQPDPNVLKRLKTEPKKKRTAAEGALREKAKKKIERFPKGYQLVATGAGIPFMKPVTIVFNSDYDYSSGKLSLG
jgi:hypothetical protein